MSAENVEIVRSLYAAVARHDSDAVLTAYDPGVEMDFTDSPFRDFVRRDVVKGHESLRDFFQERQEEAWATIEDRIDEIIDAGDQQVVSVVRSHGRGRASGAEVELVHAGLWTVEGGKIVRVQWFGSREEALEAAGIEG